MLRRVATVCCLLVCCILAVSSPFLLPAAPKANVQDAAGTSQPAQWPQWRGPGRDGRSTETGLNTNWKANPPRLLWTGEGLGHGYASLSVADRRIFTTGNQDNSQTVTAIATDTGKVLWSTPVTEQAPRHRSEGSRSTPTVDEGRLYVVSSDGQIVCLTAADGRVVWKRDFREDFGGRMMSSWGFAESPLIDGDWVVCTPGGADAMLVALDKMTGQEIWRAAEPRSFGEGKRGAGYSSVVISHGAGVKQYVQLVGGGVVGVRAVDGRLLWSYSDIANSTANIPTPIVSDNYVFCSTGYGAGAALLELKRRGDGVRADERYFLSSDTFQNHHGGMVLVDGYIYAGHGHNNGFPICLDMRAGEVMWGGDQRGVGRGSAAVVYVDGHLIFRYQTGEVALIEATPARYNLKGQFMPAYQEDQSWAHPVVAGGRLYLREQDKLLCYDVSRR